MNEEEFEPDVGMVYATALAYLCFKNGGTLTLPALPDELVNRDYAITFRFPEDGGVVFKIEMQDVH